MFGLAETIIGVFGETLDKFFPDQNKKLEAMALIKQGILKNESKIITAAAEIVGKEVASEKWYQNAWRPALMWLIIFIILNNFVIAPYINIFTGFDFTLQVNVDSVPDQLWRAIDIGLGGYVVGRSAEKIAKDMAKAKK